MKWLLSFLCLALVLPCCAQSAVVGFPSSASTTSTSPQAFAGQLSAPQFAVSKTFTATPQTIRGIVGAVSGQSTTNSSNYMDIFPVGYNPWASGIRFEDYATGLFAKDGNYGAIFLGLADDTGDSQGICMTSQRASSNDSAFCLYSHFGVLEWNQVNDSAIFGAFGTTSDVEIGLAMRVGWDATNQMAILSGGGSSLGSGVGAGLSVNGAGTGLSSTSALICDASANCGIGPQKKIATSDPFWVSPAGAVTAASYTTTGLPTGCVQYPCVVFKSSLANQSAAYNSNVYTPTVAGTYRLSCTEDVTTAGTAGTMQCGFNWKSNGSGGGASSQSSPTANMTTTGLTTQLTIVVHLDGTTPVTAFTNYTGATGTPIDNLDIAVERLQ